MKSSDCTSRFRCERPNGNVTIELLPPCGENAKCIGDINNEPFCVCKKGFLGDGYNCYKGIVTYVFLFLFIYLLFIRRAFYNYEIDYK